MNTERPEGESSGAGDTAMIVLTGLVVLALMAGLFLWFTTSETTMVAPPAARPPQPRSAETPFGDDDENAPTTNSAPVPLKDTAPKK